MTMRGAHIEQALLQQAKGESDTPSGRRHMPYFIMCAVEVSRPPHSTRRCKREKTVDRTSSEFYVTVLAITSVRWRGAGGPGGHLSPQGDLLRNLFFTKE